MPSDTTSDRLQAVLELNRSNRVGLFERACVFISDHGGNIIFNDVVTPGDLAFVIIHFEATEKQLQSMESHAADLAASAESKVVITRTNPTNASLIREHIRIYCPDFKGLLAKQMALFVKYDLDVLSHRGERVTLPFPGAPTEYIQKITLGRPPTTDWKAFQRELQDLLHSLKPTGRFAYE